MKNSNIYINATFLCSERLTGIGRFAVELSVGLKRLWGDRLIILAPPNAKHPAIIQKLGIKKIGTNKNRVLWEQMDLPIYLLRHGSPLLISFGNTAPLFYKNQAVSILDLFYHRADELFKEKESAYSSLTTYFFKTTIPIIIRNSKCVFTISQFSKDDIIGHFNVNPEKIVIVHPSLSDKFLTVSDNNLPNQYGRYILGVSAITPRKNFNGLIRAYLEAKFSDVKLVIVGGSEDSTRNYELDLLYKGNPNIIFTGYVSDDDLVNLYQHSLFFAYPSFWEGFGIPPLEAMACGCPTLVSNVTSLPEVCGDASLYVDPYNIDSIREGMERLINDQALRNQLVKKGYEQILKYGQTETINKMNATINRLNKSNK